MNRLLVSVSLGTSLFTGCSQSDTELPALSDIQTPTAETGHLSDWQSFAENTPYGSVYAPVSVAHLNAALFSPSGRFRQRFPTLTRLLSQSRGTAINSRQGLRYVHAWTNKRGQTFGWMCYPPPDPTSTRILHNDHQLLLRYFGGIEEHWNGPETFLDNQSGSLGIKDWDPGFGGREQHFNEISRLNLGSGYIMPSSYCVFTSEANGDCTVYHRKTAAVLHLGFDCGLSNVLALEGYPDLLFVIESVPDFRSWVETVAAKWLAEVGSDKTE